MAGVINRIGDRIATNNIEYYVESLADLATLPSLKNGVRVEATADWCRGYFPPIGSACLVIETSQVFVLTNNGWIELGCKCKK